MVYLYKGRSDCYIDTIGGVVWQSQKVQRSFAQSVGATFTFLLFGLELQSIAQRDVSTMTEKQQPKFFTLVRSAARSFLAGRLKPENTAPMSAAIWREARKLRDSALIVASRSRLSSLKMMCAALGNVALLGQRQKCGRLEQSYFDSVSSVARNFGRNLRRFLEGVQSSVLNDVWVWLNVQNSHRHHQDFTIILTGKRSGGRFWSAMVTLVKSVGLPGVDFMCITLSRSAKVEPKLWIT